MDHRHLAVRMEQGLAVDHRDDGEIGARAARALERPVAVARLAVDDDDRAEAGVGHVEEARVDPHVTQHGPRRRQVGAERVDAAHLVRPEVDLHQLRPAVDHAPVMRRRVVDGPQVVVAIGVQAVRAHESPVRRQTRAPLVPLTAGEGREATVRRRFSDRRRGHLRPAREVAEEPAARRHRGVRDHDVARRGDRDQLHGAADPSMTASSAGRDGRPP